MTGNSFDLWLLTRRTGEWTVDRRLVCQPTRDADGALDGARDAETCDWIDIDPATVRALEPLTEGAARVAAFTIGAAA